MFSTSCLANGRVSAAAAHDRTPAAAGCKRLLYGVAHRLSRATTLRPAHGSIHDPRR
jgi:hypothetical protein